MSKQKNPGKTGGHCSGSRGGGIKIGVGAVVAGKGAARETKKKEKEEEEAHRAPEPPEQSPHQPPALRQEEEDTQPGDEHALQAGRALKVP